MMRLAILFVFCLSSYVSAFKWTDCDPSSAFKTESFDISPSPILHPGQVNVQLKGYFQGSISGEIKVQTKLVKKFAGIPIPVPCLKIPLAEGVDLKFGSCDYELCRDLLDLIPGAGQCPQVDLPLGTAQIPVDSSFSLQLPDLSKLVEESATGVPLNYLVEGDFNLKINARSDSGSVSCLSVDFSLKKNN